MESGYLRCPELVLKIGYNEWVLDILEGGLDHTWAGSLVYILSTFRTQVILGRTDFS
jgi:hypothetical protein